MAKFAASIHANSILDPGEKYVKAYIAGPLFNDAEKAFNLKVDALVQSLGIETY